MISRQRLTVSANPVPLKTIRKKIIGNSVRKVPKNTLTIQPVKAESAKLNEVAGLTPGGREG